MEDDLGHSANYTYNGNRLASVSSTDDLITEYGYDNAANALRTIAYPNGTTRDYTFDDMGRVSTISRNGNQQTVAIDRGSFGSYAVIDSEGGVFETVVGASGEVLYMVDALGNKTVAQYNNNVAAVTSIQTAMGRTVHYDYDKDFNITQSVGPDGTATQFTYSVDFGGLERYTDAKGQSVVYSYDDKGQGNGNILADGKGGSLEYNEKGDVVSTTDRSGRNRTMEYDAQGRLLRATNADNRLQELVYDAKGNVVKLKDSLLGDTTMTYTDQERLKSIIYADGRGFSYTYDDCGRIIKQTYSDGFVQNYEYDALGRVSRMTDKNGKLLVGLEYDAVTGLLLSKTFGNGTNVHYAYDLNGNLLSMTHKGKDGSVLEAFQYTYDADGRRTQVESSEGVEAYMYDLAGQLTAVTYSDGTTESFQYDAVGNRVSANGEAYTVNELNQYLTVGNASFTYDDNGCMTSRRDANGTTSYEYDANSHLVRVVRPDGKTWSCQYDALGNRVQVNDNGQIRKQMYTLGSLPSLAAEYDASGKLIRRYILLGSMLIADVDASGNYRYYHTDGLGSTRLLTNDAGAVVSRQSYNAFGGLRTASGETMRFGFVGMYGVEVDATGLVFMRNRYYDTAIGRFTQMDPIGINAGDVNWYRYCVNSPNMAIDPIGLELVICKSQNKSGSEENGNNEHVNDEQKWPDLNEPPSSPENPRIDDSQKALNPPSGIKIPINDDIFIYIGGRFPNNPDPTRKRRGFGGVIGIGGEF
jgi:RHS repeat-associated protein